MAILDAEVVMRSKHIGGNHGGVATAMLLKVGPAKDTTVTLTSPFSVNQLVFSPQDSKVPVVDINHSLCIGVTKV